MNDQSAARRVERISRGVAALAALGCIALWAVFLWANPYAEVEGSLPRLIGKAMILVWLGGLVALYRGVPAWIYVTFALAFVPVGLYLLGAPGLFAWIGGLTLIYLLAGVAWHRARGR